MPETRGRGSAQYTWTKPDTAGQSAPKLAYVARFEPFNWLIGTGEYLDDREREIKQEVLERVDKIRIGEDGYVFVFQFDGKYLSHFHKTYVGKNIPDIMDQNGVEIHRQLLSVSQGPDGGFLEYVWHKPSLGSEVRKLAYVRAFRDWGWVIGTGVYLDDIGRTIGANRAEMGSRIRTQIRLTVVVSLASILIALILSRVFAAILQREVAVFSHFFEKAAISNEPIDKTKVSIGEFRRLSDHANRMVADRQNWEEKFAREKQRFQILTEKAPFGIMTIDPDGKVSYINPTFEDLFGYTLTDIYDERTWFRLAFPDPDYRRTAVAAWNRGIRRLIPGADESGTYKVLCKDESEKIVHFLHVKLDAGEHLLAAEDVTETKRLEDRLRQAAKMEAIGQLAGGIAHDFNNLLTAMIGYSDVLLSKGKADTWFHEKVAQIRRAADMAAGLTRQLLAFSRKQVPTCTHHRP